MNLTPPTLGRRALAELIGTALLVTVVVGSGIAAARLSPADRGLQLLENSTATTFGLAVLIVLFSPVSGAHLNPVVTLADQLLTPAPDRRPARDVLVYIGAQLIGGILGALLADAMYDLPVVQVATTERGSPGVWLAEIVATAGLVALIASLTRTGRGSLAAPAVAAYIGAAYWFTSSTSFANPAVTIGRVFSDTFAGISPASVPAFVMAQLVGASLGLGLVAVLYPDARTGAPSRNRPERSST